MVSQILRTFDLTNFDVTLCNGFLPMRLLIEYNFDPYLPTLIPTLHEA